MEYLTADYLREIECYHHVRFPEDDQEEFEREFRETLAQDPILRASLLFFVLDEDAPHSAKIQSSVSYIKTYLRDKRDAEIDKELEHQQVDTDDGADRRRGNGDRRREDSNRYERAAPQDVQYFSRLVEIAMQGDSTAAVTLPDRSNVTATAAAMAMAESEPSEPSPWLYEEEPIYEIQDVDSILSGVLARAGLLFATAPAA